MENSNKNNHEKNNIHIDGLSEQEIKKTTNIIKKFTDSYVKKDKNKSDEEWLVDKLKEELPDKKDDEIIKMSKNIIESVEQFDTNLMEINEACNKGTSTESWFTNKVRDASTGISIIEYGNYLNQIDNAINNANSQMMRTITTNSGEISKCLNLDGFIAEQYAVNTFNMQSQLEGSKFIAEVKVPGPGETYGANSFDTVIKDCSTGKIVHQYQFKFGKDANATIKMLNEGNYNNQRFVVPVEQVEKVKQAFPNKSVEAYMGGTETVHIKSKAITKEEVKKMQLDSQEKSVIPKNDWNAYNTKELAINISKNAGMVGLQSAVITTGFDLALKVVKGEKINADETIELALKTGADSGIKAAIAGAIKVATEKGIISIIPKGTPAGIIANIVCLGIENAKILAKVASGEIKITEALDRMGRTSTSMVYGLGWGATGMAFGASVLSWIPIVGPLAGGIVGGIVGYMAGDKFGSAVYSGAKKVASVAKSVAKSAWNGIKSAGRKISSGIKSVVRGIFG